MRNPLTYEPAPYTDAAITISPTPAWRWSVNRHVPEHMFVDVSDARYPMPVWAASVTECHASQPHPLDVILAKSQVERMRNERMDAERLERRRKKQRQKLIAKMARAQLGADMRAEAIRARGFTW